MPEVRLTEAAQREIDEYTETLKSSHKFGLLSIDKAKALRSAKVASMVSQAMREVDPESEFVRIKCKHCGEISAVAGDVLRFRCRCTPHVEQVQWEARLRNY